MKVYENIMINYPQTFDLKDEIKKYMNIFGMTPCIFNDEHHYLSENCMDRICRKDSNCKECLGQYLESEIE